MQPEVDSAEDSRCDEFVTYLRAGRRTGSLEFRYNHNHDPRNGQFASGPNSHLTPQSAELASRIATGFHIRTGKTLYVLSGTRTPERQAKAMIEKRPETWNALYKDKASIAELRRAYDGAIRSGRGKAGAISDMAKVIKDQESRGRYVSLHLLSRGLDLRTKTLTAGEADILRQEAMRQGAKKAFIEGGSQPHLHVQF